MSETRINISELKAEGSDLIKELVELVKEKTKANVETTADFIIVKSEEKTIPKKYLRVLLRKFLHQTELKDFFRVIGDAENTLMVKERRVAEEE